MSPQQSHPAVGVAGVECEHGGRCVARGIGFFFSVPLLPSVSGLVHSVNGVAVGEAKTAAAAATALEASER